MSAAPIDYDALAKQSGAIQPNAPAAAPAPDYDAMAKQSGAISSTPASAPSGDGTPGKIIDMARHDGVPDDEILQYIGHPNSPYANLGPSIQQARQAGKTSSQILDQIGGAATPEAPSVLGFAKNAVSSAGNLIGNTAQAVLHPVNTVKAIAQIGAGLANEYIPGNAALAQKLGDTPEDTANDNRMVDAFKQNIVGRYGSLDKFAHTLYTDPVGTLADVSALVGGVSGVARGVGAVADAAGAADLASGAGRVADAASTAANAANPLGWAAKAAGKGIDLAKAGAGKLVAKALATPDVNRLPQEAVDMAANSTPPIPLSQGDITGSRPVQAAEKTLGETVAPDKYAALRDAQQKGMFAKAQDLPGSPQTRSPYEAGQEVLDQVDAKLKDTHQAGQDAYAEFEKQAADPANSRPVAQGPARQVVTRAPNGSVTNVTSAPPPPVQMALPANVGIAKQALQGTFNRIKQSLEAVPELRRQSDPGYRVLSRLMDGPDVIPATQAEDILSLLKGIGREALMPEVKNRSQGIAAAATKVLQPAIDDALKAASPKAASALQDGRKLWAEKSALADLKEALGGSDQSHPVSAFKKLIAPKDENFQMLQQVMNASPDAAQSLRRGYLQNLFEKPTENGGFQNAQKALADWEKLGPQTKQAIFLPGQARDMDTFLKLAKRLGENPNPSGTGTVNALLKLGLVATHPGTGIPVLVFGRKLASVLYSADGAKNLAALVAAGPASVMGKRAVAALTAEDALVENRSRGRARLQANLAAATAAQ